MPTPMTSDISNDEVRVLKTIWELKAVGTQRVTMRTLASRMPDLSDTETTAMVKRLEARGLVTKKKGAGGDLLALSPLGAAFVRQLQDRQLGDLNRVP